MKLLKTACAVMLCALSAQAAAVGSLADVTVFDRAQGRQLPVYWHEGRAYVVGQPGNEYAVRVHNRNRDEVLAVVSVDGVNVISGETATPKQSGYVLSPWRLLDIAGWRKSLASTAAFYFTPLPDSYAARTGRPDHVGVIGVALYRKKQPPAEISQFAPQAPAPLARSEASRESAAAGAAADAGQAAGSVAESRSAAPRDDRLGTGHGRNETSYARHVSFERATSEPAETVMIYYDSHRNLLARGVIRETLPPQRPLPHPFPGFVPNPPA